MFFAVAQVRMSTAEKKFSLALAYGSPTGLHQDRVFVPLCLHVIGV